MKKTIVLLDKLLLLTQGKSLPMSSLKGEWFEQMRQDGILVAITHGSRKSFRVTNERIFRDYINNKYDIRDIEATREMMSSEETTRKVQVQLSGDSKFIKLRSCPGFMVNSYNPISARLNGKDIVIAPEEGTMVFMADWEHFEIPQEVLVIGIENMENFRLIREQQYLFPNDRPILFVSRYPQSKDLRKWIQKIPNEYLHYGDFDLAGIHIYETEFYKYLGDRASFFIPKDIEQRLSDGSTERYNNQYTKFKNYTPKDTRLLPLY